MPFEQRKIILTREEALQAVQSYQRANPQFLPNGEIAALSIDTDAGESVTVRVTVQAAYGRSTNTIVVDLAAEDVVEILIRCCLENNIPIPRRARKATVVTDGLLTLAIESTPVEDFELAPPAAAAPPRPAPTPVPMRTPGMSIRT